MVFQVKELVELSPFSKTTFFARFAEIKAKRKIKKIGSFIPQSEAEKIAKELGFYEELTKFIETKSRKA